MSLGMLNLGDLAILLAILLSLLGGGGILYAQRRWRDRRDAGLFRAAERLGGSVSSTDLFDPPSLHFTVEGRPALIEQEWGDVPRTRVKISLSRRSPGVFRLVRQELADADARFIGSPDLKIGDPKFDRAWYITARPASFATRIFAEDRRREVIDSVQWIADFAWPSIEITRDTLVVRVSGILRSEVDFIALAQTAIDFAGYLVHLGPDEGIAWVAGESDPGLCPVCAAPLEEGVIFCDRCRTPQHEECWKYIGQCSTYACKGKRFVA